MQGIQSAYMDSSPKNENSVMNYPLVIPNP